MRDESQLPHIPLSFEEALRATAPQKMSTKNIRRELMLGDCRQKLVEIERESVHLVITDPPYFLDGLDDKWKKGEADSTRDTGSVKGLPIGMKFDTKQGRALQDFMSDVAEKMIAVLVPGAFAVVFSQPRLAHRMAVGLENAGFEIRDLLAWHFTRRAQFKAFSMDHFVDKMDISKKERARIKRNLQGRKTPQLRPQFEAMILAQKPRKGTFIENWLEYQAGLIDAKVSLEGTAPNTVMRVEKPARSKYNGHLTVKPVRLIEHLIRLFSGVGQIVLDPFLGSGTTAVAAHRTGRSYIGIEVRNDYIKIAENRINTEIQNERN